MCEGPSKYHSKMFIGKGIEGADEHGYTYSWDSSHEDLEPTMTSDIGGREYCSYCLQPAYPIQEGLRDYPSNRIYYDVTGYTCICQAAEDEKEYRKKIKEMKNRHYEEAQELKNMYRPKLSISPTALAKKMQEVHLAKMERAKDMHSYFDYEEGGRRRCSELLNNDYRPRIAQS